MRLLLSLLASFAAAQSPALPPRVPVLFVTHASERYDPRRVAKPGVDRAVAAFAEKGWPVVSLKNCDSGLFSEPYLKRRDATIELCSSSGEHEVRTGARPLYFAGGYFAACSLETVQHALASALRETEGGIELHYVADGTYTDRLGGLGTLSQAVNDPYGSLDRVLLTWKLLVRDLVEGRDALVAARARRLRLTLRRKHEKDVTFLEPEMAPAIPVTILLE